MFYVLIWLFFNCAHAQNPLALDNYHGQQELVAVQMQELKNLFFQVVSHDLFDEQSGQDLDGMARNLYGVALWLAFFESIVEFQDSPFFYNKSGYVKQYQWVGWNNALLYYPLIGELVYQVMNITKGIGIDSFSADGIRFNRSVSLSDIDPFNQTFQFLKNIKKDSLEWAFLQEIVKEFYQKMSDWFMQHRLRQIFLKDEYFYMLRLQDSSLSTQLYEQYKLLISELYSFVIRNQRSEGVIQDLMYIQEKIFHPINFQ